MKTILRPCTLAALLALAAPWSHALDLRPDGASLRAGIGKSDSTSMLGAGLMWDWDFERLRRHAEVTAHTELIVDRWRYDAAAGGRDALTQVILLPTLRMQLSQGRSPLFVEVGVGASWMNQRYETPHKSFSTQWNFYDVIGVGRRLGADGKHEIGLRWAHTSNAGIKKPNPGQDFIQLRYMVRF